MNLSDYELPPGWSVCPCHHETPEDEWLLFSNVAELGARVHLDQGE